MQQIIRYILAFFILWMIQYFVLSAFSTNSIVDVYIYIMLIIMLNMNISRALVIIIAALIGAIVDMIEGTVGLFTMTMIWFAFIRQYIFRVTVEKHNIQFKGVPLSSKVGNKRFFNYVFISTLCWSIPFFIIETMGSIDIINLIIRIALNSSVITLLIYFIQLPLNKQKY